MQEKLLEYLVSHKLITRAQADALRTSQQESRRPIRELVLEQTGVSEEQLLEALSAVSRIPIVRLYERTIAVDVR